MLYWSEFQVVESLDVLFRKVGQTLGTRFLNACLVEVMEHVLIKVEEVSEVLTRIWELWELGAKLWKFNYVHFSLEFLYFLFI